MILLDWPAVSYIPLLKRRNQIYIINTENQTTTQHRKLDFHKKYKKKFFFSKQVLATPLYRLACSFQVSNGVKQVAKLQICQFYPVQLLIGKFGRVHIRMIVWLVATLLTVLLVLWLLKMLKLSNMGGGGNLDCF